MVPDEKLGLTSVVVQTEGLMASEIDDEVVMLNAETGKYYGLDPTSASIWRLLAQPRPLAEVCDRLLVEYQVDRQTCEADVLTFVRKLADAKLVRIVQA